MKKRSVSKRLMICLCISFSIVSNHEKCFLQIQNHGFSQLIRTGMIPLDTGAELTRKINSIAIQINYPGFLLYCKKSNSKQWRQSQTYLLIKPVRSGAFERMEKKLITFSLSFFIPFSL